VTEQRGRELRKGSVRGNLKREGEIADEGGDFPSLLWFPLRTAPRAQRNAQSD
jgi:hypothetical protein